MFLKKVLHNPVIGFVMQTGSHLCHNGDELGFGEPTECRGKVGACFRSKGAGTRRLAFTQLVRIEAQKKRGEGESQTFSRREPERIAGAVKSRQRDHTLRVVKHHFLRETAPH